MLGRVASVVALVLLLAQPGFAQEPPPAPIAPAGPAAKAAGAYGAKGTMEAEGGLAIGYAREGDNWDLLIVPGFRYFVIDGLSVGGTLRIGYHGGWGAMFQFVPGVEYNFNLGTKMYPYVGAGLGFDYASISQTVCVPFAGCVSASGSDTAFLLDFEGGVKFDVAPHMLVGVGLDIPLGFHSGEMLYYVNVLGRFIYTF
jgi:opacity protein-like surface antigen